MQASDKNNNSFDKEFFDVAWENMKTQLDEEMPVKKKRRRFFIWFFLMAGCAIGIIFWNNNLISSEVEKEIPMAINSMTIDEMNEKDNNTLSEIKISNKENTKQIPTTRNQIYKDKKNTIQETTASESINFSKKITPRKKLNSSSKTVQDITIASIQSAEPILDVSFNDKKIAINENYLKEKATGNICPPKRSISFEVQGGLAYDFTSSKKIGGTTGINVHFPIGKKWGLQTGLAYSLLPTVGEFQVSENFEAVVDESTLTMNSQALINADLSLYSVSASTIYQLKKTHFVEIPLLATYQLNRKWNFKAGLNWSKALKNVERIQEQDLILVDNDPNSNLLLENFRTNNISNESNSVLKNSYVSGVLGVSFNPSKKLSLNLFYYRESLKINTSSNLQDEYDTSFLQIPGAFNSVESMGKKDIYRSLRMTVGYRF